MSQNRVCTTTQFLDVFDSTVVACKEIARLKGAEYSGDIDCLANFRRNARNIGLPKEVIWAVYAAKHWDAIMQYCADKAAGKHRERLELLDGRVDDLINYLILLKCMLVEDKV